MTNPFILKAAKKMLAEKGIEVGSTVTVEWTYDRAYGSGHASHTGVVSAIDDWLRVEGSNASPGYLHLPLTSIASIENLSVDLSDADEKVPS